MSDTQPIVDQSIPVGVLAGVGVLVGLTLALAAAAHHQRVTAPPAKLPPPLASLSVRFADRPDGAIAMLDARDGHELSVVPPRSNGFIRGVLRGMFRTRKLESLGHDASFTLNREADGKLSLLDPQTSRRIELDSFGPTNSQAFAQLLEDGTKAQTAKTEIAKARF